MITENGVTLAVYRDNINVYPDTVALFQAGAVTPSPGCTLIGWNFRGCYTDKISARTLGNALGVPGGQPAMTIEACLAACQFAGYVLAGVEYSGECCKSSSHCHYTWKNSADSLQTVTTPFEMPAGQLQTEMLNAL
jgi:hypothetical protein